jgi:hypothetical protein
MAMCFVYIDLLRIVVMTTTLVDNRSMLNYDNLHIVVVVVAFDYERVVVVVVNAVE